MPYLTQQRKDELLHGACVETPGDLNYTITKAIQSHVEFGDISILSRRINDAFDVFLSRNGRSYTTFNAAVGAIVCAGAEFTRRTADQPWTDAHEQVQECIAEKLEHFYITVVGPYEDTKIKENGDVY